MCIIIFTSEECDFPLFTGEVFLIMTRPELQTVCIHLQPIKNTFYKGTT